jgi:hypothetical protein
LEKVGVECRGCGEDFPEADGPTHQYVLSSPGCWKAYGHVLAREYQNRNYWPLHRMTVDAYAVQHRGVDTPQARNSVAIHLSRLCVMLQAGWPMEKANAAMVEITARKMRYPWLVPPENRGALTIRHVLNARTPAEHLAAVDAWAHSTWDAWAEHHEAVRTWVKTLCE